METPFEQQYSKIVSYAFSESLSSPNYFKKIDEFLSDIDNVETLAEVFSTIKEKVNNNMENGDVYLDKGSGANIRLKVSNWVNSWNKKIHSPVNQIQQLEKLTLEHTDALLYWFRQVNSMLERYGYTQEFNEHTIFPYVEKMRQLTDEMEKEVSTYLQKLDYKKISTLLADLLEAVKRTKRIALERIIDIEALDTEYNWVKAVVDHAPLVESFILKFSENSNWMQAIVDEAFELCPVGEVHYQGLKRLLPERFNKIKLQSIILSHEGIREEIIKLYQEEQKEFKEESTKLYENPEGANPELVFGSIGLIRFYDVLLADYFPMLNKNQAKPTKRIVWKGTQKELAEMFATLKEKGWIEGFEYETIKQAFTKSDTIHQVLKPAQDPRTSKPYYDQIFTTEYKPHFQDIKENPKK